MFEQTTGLVKPIEGRKAIRCWTYSRSARTSATVRSTLAIGGMRVESYTHLDALPAGAFVYASRSGINLMFCAMCIEDRLVVHTNPCHKLAQILCYAQSPLPSAQGARLRCVMRTAAGWGSNMTDSASVDGTAMPLQFHEFDGVATL